MEIPLVPEEQHFSICINLQNHFINMVCTMLCEYSNESIVFRFSVLDFFSFSHGWWLACGFGVAIYFVQTMYVFLPRKKWKKVSRKLRKTQRREGKTAQRDQSRKLSRFLHTSIFHAEFHFRPLVGRTVIYFLRMSFRHDFSSNNKYQ